MEYGKPVVRPRWCPIHGVPSAYHPCEYCAIARGESKRTWLPGSSTQRLKAPKGVWSGG